MTANSIIKIPHEKIPLLRKILWLDVFLGGITAILGLGFSEIMSDLLGLSINFILLVCSITLCYAIVAFILVNQKSISIPLLRILIAANWFWTIVSFGLIIGYFSEAYLLGKVFLILQLLVVGGLAYAEGKQLQKMY